MLRGPSRSKKRWSALLSPPSALAGLLAATLVVTTPTGAQAAPAGRVPAAASFAANCGTKPVTLQGVFESGFPDAIDLAHLFTKQYPNVTWNIREDPFATITSNAPLILSGPKPPDLMRMPQINGLVKDHLLKDMDGYFKTFGWDKFPASDLI